jgi:hypothetical protein
MASSGVLSTFRTGFVVVRDTFAISSQHIGYGDEVGHEAGQNSIVLLLL